jgi:hypothetical protein
MASFFLFYAWGAYRVWDKTDHRAQEAKRARVDAEAALEVERAKPRGPAGIIVNGGTNNKVWDNKIYGPTPQVPPHDAGESLADETPG